VFLLSNPTAVAAILALQILLWLAAGQPAAQMPRLLRRLGVFFFFILLSFAFFPEEGAADWIRLPLGIVELEVSASGLRAGLLMCLRVYTVIFTSLLVRRSMKAAEFVDGLRGLFMPEQLALAIDATLYLLEPRAKERLKRGAGGDGQRDGGGGGGGGGGGQGGGGHKKLTVVLRDILRGDISFLVERIEATLARGSAYVADNHAGMDAARARDLGVISGMTLTRLTLKWLKVLPGLPIAPGHKAVLLLPLYILTAELTRTRWGATLTGSCMGVIAFLMGDGRYGIFEILKHIAPGLLIDLLLPLTRVGGRPGVIRYGLLGVIAALGRFATSVVVALLMGAPPAFFAMVAPLALVHASFGAASGLVSVALMRSTETLRKRESGPDDQSA